jgi:tetratricopeptide (TPR) repeat protein
MEQINNLKELINQGKVDQAIEQINRLLLQGEYETQGKDTLFYLRGNAYRKKGDWKQALDNYQWAIDLNPNGPATQARKMAIDILNFYHKDMYNQ